MSIKNTKLGRWVLLVGMILSLLATACASDISFEDLGSTTNALPNLAANQKGDSLETPKQIVLNQEASGVAWIEVNHILGHKWSLTYDHRAQEATLKVAIVIWDRERHVLIDALHGCEYVFSASNVAGGGDRVKLPLDSIEENIEDCYEQYSPGSNVNIPSTEFYRKIQFEVFGEWSAPPPSNATLALHDSFKLGFEPGPGSSVEMFLALRSQNGQIEKYSAPAPISGSTDYMGVTNIDFWSSVHDQNIQASYTESYTKSGTNSIEPTIKTIDGQQNLIPFFIGDSSLEIEIPNNFDLRIIVIDPPGYGGGNPG